MLCYINDTSEDRSTEVLALAVWLVQNGAHALAVERLKPDWGTPFL